MTWKLFSAAQGLHDVLYFKWMQLTNAFPNNWLDQIKCDCGSSRTFVDRSPHMLSLAKIYPFKKLSSSELYKTQVQHLFRTPTSQKSICKLLSIEKLPWKSIYSCIYKTSVDFYSRIFQYKCLNNILYLNNVLFKMGLSDSPLCSYCSLYNESQAHLFFECYVTKRYWTQLQNFFKDKLNIPNLDLQSAVIGFINPGEILINNILLTFKMVLYKNRGKNLRFEYIIKYIKMREKLRE